MDSQWLKTQLAHNPDKNKADLAKAIGVQPSGISKILAGTRQIKAHEYIAMRRFFGLPVDGQSAVSQGELRALKALTAQGLKEEQRTGDFDWVQPENTKDPHPLPDHIKIFKVSERAMEPDFKEGEYVLVDLSDKMPWPPGVFLVSDGFGEMFRNCSLVPKANPPAVLISAIQKGFMSQTLKLEDYLIKGRIIGKVSMF
jgi:hypothetical protein